MLPEEPRPPAAQVVRFVTGLPASDSVLDLGCGDGRLTTALHWERLVAADVSGLALERVRRRVPEAELVLLDADAPLPLADNAFDLVLCAETIEHVRDVQLLVSEIRRVLRPGGRLALTAPAHGRLTGLAIALRGFERGFDPLSPHLRFFTRRSLAALLADMGFEVESLVTRAGTLLAVATR